MMFSALRPAQEAASATNSRRKAAEKLIFDTVSILDPTGTNTKRYQTQFAQWSDIEFQSFMHGVREKHIKLVLYVPNLKLNLRLKNIFAAAHFVGLELFERIRLWDPTTRRYFLTPHKYPVLMLPVRRLKQFLMSKISVPESDSKIDAFSGQVVKPDKGASISAVEMQTILSKDLKASISELIRVRGGDINAYAQFRGQLEETGSASLNSISDDSRARSSVVLGTYFKAAGIDNNL